MSISEQLRTRPDIPEPTPEQEKTAQWIEQEVQRIWTQIHKLSEDWRSLLDTRHDSHAGERQLRSGAKHGLAIGTLQSEVDALAREMSSADHEPLPSFNTEIGAIRVALRELVLQIHPHSKQKNGNGNGSVNGNGAHT